MKHGIIQFNDAAKAGAYAHDFEGEYVGMVRMPDVMTYEASQYDYNTGQYKMVEQTRATPPGCELWRMTKEYDDLIKAPAGGAVYGTTFKECLRQLLEIYPADSGRVRVSAMCGSYRDCAKGQRYGSFRTGIGGNSDRTPIEALVHPPIYVVPEEASRIEPTYSKSKPQLSAAEVDELIAAMLAEVPRDGILPITAEGGVIGALRRLFEESRSDPEDDPDPEEFYGDEYSLRAGNSDCEPVDWAAGQVWPSHIRHNPKLAAQRKARARGAAKRRQKVNKRLDGINAARRAIGDLERALQDSLHERCPPIISGIHTDYWHALAKVSDVESYSRDYQGKNLVHRLELHAQIFGIDDTADWPEVEGAIRAYTAFEVTPNDLARVGLAPELLAYLRKLPRRRRRVSRRCGVKLCPKCNLRQPADPRRVRWAAPEIHLCRRCSSVLTDLKPKVEEPAAGPQVEGEEVEAVVRPVVGCRLLPAASPLPRIEEVVFRTRPQGASGPMAKPTQRGGFAGRPA